MAKLLQPTKRLDELTRKLKAALSLKRYEGTPIGQAMEINPQVASSYRIRAASEVLAAYAGDQALLRELLLRNEWQQWEKLYPSAVGQLRMKVIPELQLVTRSGSDVTGIEIGYRPTRFDSEVSAVSVSYQNGRRSDFMRTNRGLEGPDTIRRFFRNKHLDLRRLRNKTVLDAGTGDGAVVEDLRQAGVRAVGLDLYLNPSQQRKRYFFQRSMTDTGFRAKSFDVIYSTQSLFTYTAPAGVELNALKELARVLKPGGELRISPIDNQGSRFKRFQSLIEQTPELELIEHYPNPEGVTVILRKRPEAP